MVRSRAQQPFRRRSRSAALEYAEDALPAAGWEARYAPAPDVQSSVVDQEAVLLKQGTGRSYTLNPVGTLVWELVSARRPLEEVLVALAARFDAPRPQLRRDLLELVAQLQAEGLLEAQP